MKSVTAEGKGARKANSIRDYFGLAYADKCYLSEKTVNLVVGRESALVLAEKILRAVNAGKQKIDLRVYAPSKGVMKSGKRVGITVTSPRNSDTNKSKS